MMVTGLISFSVLFALFSVVCYLSGHDSLMMLYMYSAPFFLSVAIGAYLPFDMSVFRLPGRRSKLP
ncbi:hypothetical protein ACIQWS_01120 [Phyllobacterium sp. NPDC097923]|uniref:hypothetical protein n=1 Tax=Phyllobacterium sp. NPDC097923 TaxID=3364404 RepID=UPI00383B8C7F